MAFVTNFDTNLMRNNPKRFVHGTGIDVGIPLNIVDNIFTNLHYGHDISTPKIILLQFLIGYYTYGKDRYKDALEYFDGGGSGRGGNGGGVNHKKVELYEKLYRYRHLFKLSYCLVFYLIFSLLDGDILTNSIVIGLLYSTEYYKDIKKSNVIGGKSVYVSTMWTLSAVILPCILHDNNLSIFHHPADYLPCFLTIFAGTNIADIQDIEEDTIEQINTLPVTFGKDKTIAIILLSLSLSSFLFGINQNYLSRPLINGGFELQNAILSAVTYTL